MAFLLKIDLSDFGLHHSEIIVCFIRLFYKPQANNTDLPLDLDLRNENSAGLFSLILKLGTPLNSYTLVLTLHNKALRKLK